MSRWAVQIDPGAGLLVASGYGWNVSPAGHALWRRGGVADAGGGAGKTPAALAVAQLLHAAHERPFFLSRGYGGQLAGPVRVNATLHRAADVGDEPMLLARLAPTVVARDRVAGAAFARSAGASVIVMDDGFQNPS